MQAPLAPDTSKRAFYQENGLPLTGFRRFLGEKLFGRSLGEAYDQWKLRKENVYNKDLQDYETWMKTPEVAGMLYDAAGYNRNYAALGANVGQVGSPGSYTTPEINSDFTPTPVNLLSSILALAGQGTDIASKGVGTYMNILLGLDNLKTTSLNRSLNGLKIDLQKMTLYKLMTQLFNPQDLEQVDSWLNGKSIDVDAQTSKEMEELGVNDPLYLFLSRGPLRSQTGAQTSSLWTALHNAIKTGEKTEAETGLKEKEGEMYNWYKSAGILGPILQVILKAVL